MSYCIKEKKVTENINPEYVRAKNGRLMLRTKCASCGITKTRFVKESEGGNIDIHKAMMPFLPKKGLTLPGYNYCGPGNPLNNGLPVNELDQICKTHDYCYSDNPLDKSKCDKKMLKNLKTSKSKTIGEAVAKNVIVKPIITAKHTLGLGQGQSQRRSQKNGKRR